MKITICGSMAFYPEMLTIEQTLKENGHDVRVPLLEIPFAPTGERAINFQKYVEENGGIDAFPSTHEIWNYKEGAINDHFKKVVWSDAILVVNPEKRGVKGYVGGNTLIEIGLAFYLKKPIYILNQIASELSYRQEIFGMKPIFLDGDLGLIGVPAQT